VGAQDSNISQCDEQGPPCANCVVRGATNTCVYTTSAGKYFQGIDPSCSRDSSANPLPEITFTVGSRQILELELIHRWTVGTYKSFCGVADDFHYLQTVLPQCALQYDYLLHGILAVSALDIATSEVPGDEARSAEYVQMAMEYYDKASVSFRQQLGNITQDNIHCIYMFSVMALCINMAMTQCKGLGFDKQQSLLDCVPVFFELGLASTSFFITYPEWMLNGPYSTALNTAAILVREPSPKLDHSTNEAISRLKTIIENGSAVLERTEEQTYSKAVGGLYLCYVEDKKNLVKGFCIAFPSLAGKEFTVEVGNLKPIALLILMHWAVSLHQLGESFWWARSVGLNLAQEISATLLQLQPDLLMLREWRAGIQWARSGVGLPLLI